ncbi:CARDB domain-containing protein [Halorubrum sp. FL23]|uniref:CARDB domain-containing protein n=1 Tax=Halorubrum sp. FL23 TaxID=3458704 RepID=UPI0040336E97
MTEYETSVPTLYDRYIRNLRAGDLPKAVEMSVAMETQEPSITGLLTDFESAVTDGEEELAKTLLTRIQEAYDRQSEDEQAEVAKASVAIEQSDLTAEERENLLTLVRDSSQLSLQRSNFYNQAVIYLETDDESVATDTATTAAETRERETSFQQTRNETVEPDTESLSASPTLFGTDGPSQVVSGESFTVSLRVGNVGGATVSGVSIEVDASNGATPMDQTIPLNAIEPDGRQQVSVEIQTPTPEQTQVTFKLIQDGETLDSATETFTVIDQTVSVRAAITGGEDEPFDSVQLQRAISHWSADSEVPGTSGETVSTEQIQSFITNYLENTKEGPQ